MAEFHIREVAETLKRDVKVQAGREGVSIKFFVQRALERELVRCRDKDKEVKDKFPRVDVAENEG